MWNLVLGFFYHYKIGVVVGMTIDEVTAERNAVSCHFSLDVVANQNDNDGESDDSRLRVPCGSRSVIFYQQMMFSKCVLQHKNGMSQDSTVLTPNCSSFC